MNPSKPKLSIETENFIVGEFNFMFKKYAKDCSFVSASMFADKLNITLVKYSTFSTEIFETAMKISEYGFFCTDAKGDEYIYLNDVGTTSSKQESTIFMNSATSRLITMELEKTKKQRLIFMKSTLFSAPGCPIKYIRYTKMVGEDNGHRQIRTISKYKRFRQQC